MVRDVKEARTIGKANFSVERFGFGDGGAIDTVSGFEKELSEIRRGVSSSLQALEQEGSESFEVVLIRILPEISMESPINESVEDTRGLRGRGRSVQVEVHWFLVSSSRDASLVVQLKGKVKERDRTSWFRGFPFESRSGVAEGVHRRHESCKASGTSSLEDESIIDETTVEENAVWIGVGNQHGLFVVRIINGSVCASAWRTHCSPVALAPESVAKGEDVSPHDDVKAIEYTLHRELGRKLGFM
jgi:hypothetical protein